MTDSEYGKAALPSSAQIPAPELPYLPPMSRSYRPKIGLIGCGGISEYHLRAYRAMGLDVAALCDIDQSKAEARRSEFYPEAQVCSHYRDLLERADIEVVDVAVHAAERPPIIRAALNAGKHVLSQKPFVLDLPVGKELVALADEKGLKLAVNQNGRWAPHFSYMRQAIDAGLVGKVNTAAFSVQWDHTWIAGTPFDEMLHVILFDFAVHWFDICAAFFGDATPMSVSASASRMHKQINQPPMLAHVIIDYPHGQATMNFNGHVRFGQQDTTVVCGELGTLRSSGTSLSEQRVTLHTEQGWSSPELHGTWFESGFQGAMGELLSAIEDNREPNNSARGNLRSLALCFAAVSSADTGGLPVTPGIAIHGPR
jgi:predicted dehydrogenase